MKKASYIYPSDIFPGDIVKMYCAEYIDFPGRPWNEHFSSPRPRFFKVTTCVTNNGNFMCKDKYGRTYIMNALDVEIMNRGNTYKKMQMEAQNDEI